MKKVTTTLLSIIFMAGTLNAQFSFMPQNDAYRMSTQGQTIDNLKTFSTPSQTFAILPGRPLQATGASGERMYLTPSGKLAASFDKAGNMTFSLGNVTKTFSANGELASVSKNVKGTNMIEVTNEFNEVLSYKELGHGGVVVATYDKDKNLTATYNYDVYGKALVSIVNEMSKSMTVFDEKTGLAMYDLDADGFRVGKYIYDDKNILSEKVDVYGNVTYFDGKGNVTHSTDKDGLVLSKYNYGYNEKGDYILESVTDPRTSNITYFENGKQIATKNYAGAQIVDYFWMGSKLIASFDRQNQQTTWYAVDGKATHTTVNDQLVNKNLFSNGKLVGVWDVRTNQVTVLQNERREVVIQLGNAPNYPTEPKTLVRCYGETGEVVLSLDDFQKYSDLGKVFVKIEEFTGYVLKSDDNGNIVEYEPLIEPTAEMVNKWIEDGLIDNKYLFNSL